MRLLRAQMPMRPEYIQSHRANLTPWVHIADALNNTTFGGGAGLPPSDAGDIIIAFAGSHTTDIIPTTGTGFTSIDSDNTGGVATVAGRLAFKVSAVNSDTIGGFTNANKLGAVVIKGARIEANGTVNGATLYSNTALVFTYPALTIGLPQRIILGHQADDAEAHLFPAGFTQEAVTGSGSNELRIAVSDNLQSSWPGATVAQTGSNPAITFAVALRGALGQFR